MRWAVYEPHIGDIRNKQRILIGKRKSRHYWRLKPRWEDNVKRDLKGKGY
jgi:hypothetical protein